MLLTSMTFNGSLLKANTSEIKDIIVDGTTISIDRSLKDYLDALKLVPQESYNSELLRLLRTLRELQLENKEVASK